MKQLTPRWIALFTITAITLYVTWLVFQPFVGVLLWSLMLSVIAAPLYRLIGHYTPSPNVCALLTLVAVIVIVVIPIFFIGSAALNHADEAADTVQAAFTKLSDPDSAHMQWLSRYVDVKTVFRGENVKTQAKALATVAASYSADIVGWTALALVQLLLVLFTTYYMLRDGGKLLLAARNLLPLDKHQADGIFNSIQTIVSASLRGTVLIAAIQGALGGIAFWVLGLPTAALWGVIMFFMSLVPVVGSSVIWVPAAIYLAANGAIAKAVILALWGVGAIAMVDSILRPVLVGSKTRMHELTVFFSVLGGLKLFGPVGIVVGPIVVALSAGLMRVFQESGEEPKPQSAPAERAGPKAIAGEAPAPSQQPPVSISGPSSAPPANANP